MNDILAQPIQIGQLQAKNRILMPPMHRPWSDLSGEVSDRHIEFYHALSFGNPVSPTQNPQQRAQGGVGTIVIETTAVLRKYRLNENNIGIWSDKHIDGLSKLSDVIRKNNVLAFIQINHNAVDHALSSEEIAITRNAFVDASVRAEEAGFQGVELHAAHGYILSQLLSPIYSYQKDEYGGSIDGRMRLILEIIPLIRERRDFGLGIRLGIDSLEDGIEMAKKFDALVDYLSISNGAGGGAPIPIPDDYPFSPTVYRAEQVKPHVTVPVVAVGQITTGEIARQILSQGIADLIAVGRGMLGDARWAEKALNYLDNDIQPYTG